MKRRGFGISLCGAAAMSSLPLARLAAQPKAVVGYLSGGVGGTLAPVSAAFRDGLATTGHVEGRGLVVEYRWAGGEPDRLPALAAELAGLRVGVIAAVGGDAPALAAMAAAPGIPIVFLTGGDPVKAGIVANLRRPGGNVTGLSLFAGAVDAKRLEQIHDLVPRAQEIAVLVSPASADSASRLSALEEAARAIGLRLLPLRIVEEADFETAFATIAARRPGALFVFSSPFFDARRPRIVGLAARHAIPASYAWREFAVDGGLMSYGTSLAGASRQVGIYVGRILNGERAGDLPVQQPTTFELVVNLGTARTLGLVVPPALLARADEVIE